MGGLPSSTGQLPSAADGSRIDAIPNGRIASVANTKGRAGRWGGPPSTYAVLSHFRALGTCASSGPAAVHTVRTLSIRRLGCRGHLTALGTCVPWFPGHWPPGVGVQGPWHLRLPPPGPFGVACQGLRHLRSRWPRGSTPARCQGGRIRPAPSPPASLP